MTELRIGRPPQTVRLHSPVGTGIALAFGFWLFSLLLGAIVVCGALVLGALGVMW